MSLFGSLMGDFDDDIFGSHMNAMNMQMRSMNRLMNSFMPDPFNMLAPFDGGFQQNALMERQNGPPMGGGLFGFPAMPHMQMMGMPNMNRLLSADIGNNGSSFCSSSVITMSSGPDGRPQIYQATSSTKTGPGGIRETRRTVQDSVNGVKKMAIGHHIGERAHIIEKEQDVRSGQLEERQEFINLDEDEAEDFDREFTTKASAGRHGHHRAIGAPPTQTLTIEPLDDDDDDEVIETTNTAPTGRPQIQRPSSSSSGPNQRRYLPALPTPPSQPSHQNSVHPHPYNSSAARRSHHHHHHHHHQHRSKHGKHANGSGVSTAANAASAATTASNSNSTPNHREEQNKQN
ncbi:myeloid leukemia factor isoform X2 [Haematobia irritans]|uniref:myeloid leukemia factor isoform X2 n=1 Tax=Haematobia irritans TaxID=7368 RepID=UPI003F4FEF3D